MMGKNPPTDIDAYIRGFPSNVRSLLESMRRTIQKVAPRAEETVSYNLPVFALSGKTLVWFAAFKSHVGFYPGARAIVAFGQELSQFKTAKGSVQFPFEDGLPLELVSRMVRFCAERSRNA